MDKAVQDGFFDHPKENAELGDLKLLLDEGLDLLANYARITDDGVRRALLSLVESLSKPAH